MKSPFVLRHALSGKALLRSLSLVVFSAFIVNSAYAQQSSVTLTSAGKAIYKNGDKERIISENPDDIILSTPNNDLIFYIERKLTGKTDVNHYDTRIMSFNINNGKRKELVEQGAKADMGYKVNDEMAAICLDKVSNRLYFSTVATNYKIQEYTTWYYDLATGDVRSFKDGKVTSADEYGNITVQMNGLDPKGAYTQTAIYASNGNLVTMKDRQY